MFPAGSTGQLNPDNEHHLLYKPNSKQSSELLSPIKNGGTSGFVLRLNPTMEQSPTQNGLTELESVREEIRTEKKNDGAAIRVEKQTSYTRSPSDSSGSPLKQEDNSPIMNQANQ